METIVANLCLVVLTACLFGLVRYHGQVLEQETAKSKQALAVRDLQLEKLTFALSNQARSKTSAIEANARLLLDNYGGFLPRQGHEYAEQIKEASIQMEQLRQDLVASPGPTVRRRQLTTPSHEFRARALLAPFRLYPLSRLFVQQSPVKQRWDTNAT